MSDEAIKKQIEGVCAEISEKNDWVTFSIDVGRQYPVRLSTKLEALVKAGRDAKNNKAVWTFSESQGGENPNKPGTHYINRRLEKVDVGGVLDPALGGSPAAGAAGGGGVAPRSPDERHSIERQTIVKAAVPIYDQFADEDLFFSFLEKLAEFVAGSPATAATPAAKAASGDPGPTPPASEFPQDDSDDIPFAWIDNYEATGMGMLPRFYMS